MNDPKHVPGIMNPIPLDDIPIEVWVRAAWSQYLSDGSNASYDRYKKLKEQLENTSNRHGEYNT